MGALSIRIEDVKRKEVIIEGPEKCCTAQMLLPPLLKLLYDNWRKEPNRPDSDLIPPLTVEYQDLRYVFIDCIWD